MKLSTDDGKALTTVIFPTGGHVNVLHDCKNMRPSNEYKASRHRLAMCYQYVTQSPLMSMVNEAFLGCCGSAMVFSKLNKIHEKIPNNKINH